MKNFDLNKYREVWLVDFEFSAPPGERPTPVCMVARELKTCRTLRLFQDELRELKQAPFLVDHNALFVAYYASAEFGCFKALGWALPENVLDLFAEFRVLTNGKEVPCGSGLIGALTYYGLGSIGAEEKESMRELAMRGGTYTQEEQNALLEYCETDVVALAKLLPVMLPHIDAEYALLRGNYMKAAAEMEYVGVPIDLEALKQLREYWPHIQDRLIERIDANYGVFEGRTFKSELFEEYLVKNNIPWPRHHTERGGLVLDEETFREMSRAHPVISPLRELRHALSQMRLADLSVGADARNRCLLSPFQARTGRNQPSTSKFIFGPSVWLRGLIRPEPGMALAYIDWSQQEFGIAAALSGDTKMKTAYDSGDPYLAFAKQAGAVPEDATKKSHKEIREQYKACALAVQYGMAEFSLASRIGKTTFEAKELLRKHHETYPVFWRWSDAAVDHAMQFGFLYTVFGWNVQVEWKFHDPEAGKKKFRGNGVPNNRSLRNFPMQANGAEMLRLAVCMTIERGVRVCAPVHDAIFIEAPLEQIEEAVKITQEAMRKASSIVLSGFELRSDANIICYPDRYEDERGSQMWKTIWDLIKELVEAKKPKD